MSEFYINTGAALGAADEIRNAAKMLNECNSDILSVTNAIGCCLGSAGPSISDQLKSLSSELLSGQASLSEMGDVLYKVVEAYRKTEQEIIGEANAINKNKGIGKAEYGSGSSDTSLASGIDTAKCMKTKGREKLLNTPDPDMDALIDEFEKKHVIVAWLFDLFLESGDNNMLNDDDKRNIKYLTYTAPEPYRSIFLTNLNSFMIGDGDLYDKDKKGIAQYKHRTGQDYIDYNYPSCFGSDPRGPYTTFFHECGHCIDDNADAAKFWGWDTEYFEYYSDELGKTNLHDLILYDVYRNENNPYSVVNIANDINAKGGPGAGANVENVIRAFCEGDNSSLSPNELAMYNSISSKMSKNIKNDAKYEAVSDVYGGVSDNEFRNGYGHDNDKGYWDDESNPGKELWAEFFSYKMADCDEALLHLKEFFPASYKLLEYYACNIDCSYE